MATIKNTPDKPKLAENEKRCLSALKAVLRMSPVSPSVQDVADEMGVSKAQASVLLIQLQEKGRVTRDGRKSRTLRLAPRSGLSQVLPLVPEVGAPENTSKRGWFRPAPNTLKTRFL